MKGFSAQEEQTAQEIGIVTKSVTTTGFWIAAGFVITLLVDYFIARIVGPSIFGAVSLGISALGILQILVTLGTDRGVVRYVSDAYGRKSWHSLMRSYELSFRASLFISAGLIVLYYLVLRNPLWAIFQNDANVILVLDAFVLIGPVAGISILNGSVLTGLQRQDYQQLEIFAFRPFVRLIAFLLLATWFLHLEALVHATIVASIAGMVFLWYVRRRHIGTLTSKDAGVGDSPTMREFLNFSLPLALIPVLNLATQRFDIILSGHFLSLEETGVYSIARRVSTLMLTPILLFGGIIGPTAAKMLAQEQTKSIERVYAFATKWTFAISALMFMICFLGAEDLLRVFGDAYVDGGGALRILSIGFLVNASVGPSGTFLIMMDKSKVVLINSIVGAALSIGLSLAFAPTLGGEGIALAISSAFAVVNILSFFEITLLLRIRPAPMRAFVIRYSVLGVSMLTTRVLLSWLPFETPFIRILFIGFVGMSIFCALAVVIEGLTKEDKEAIKSLIVKFRSDKQV